jgi:excisionase family DNA binding protein
MPDSTAITWLTIRQVIEHTGYSRENIRDLIHRGTLPSAWAHGRYLVREDALTAFLANRKASISAARSAAGKKGNHNRYHLDLGVSNSRCEWCQREVADA